MEIKLDHFSLILGNITIMGPTVTVRWPKTMNNLSAKYENVKFLQFIKSVIRLVYFTFGIWNITRVNAGGPRFSTRKQWATFQIYYVQFVPASAILRALRNRQCHNGHNRGDLAEFGPITTTQSRFIMAISWYNCAKMKQNQIRLPNVYDRCALTAAPNIVIFHIPTDK